MDKSWIGLAASIIGAGLGVIVKVFDMDPLMKNIVGGCAILMVVVGIVILAYGGGQWWLRVVPSGMSISALIIIVALVSFFLGWFTRPMQKNLQTKSSVPSASPALRVEPSPVEVKDEQKEEMAGPYQYQNIMTIGETLEMAQKLSGLLKMESHVIFVITAPVEVDCAVTFQSDFYALIVAACQLAGNSPCTIEPAPDPRTDIDTGIPPPEYPGVVIHHEPTSPSDVISTNYMWTLGRFNVRKSSHVPEGIARLNVSGNPRFYWFELGPGCPWSDRRVCGE